VPDSEVVKSSKRLQPIRIGGLGGVLLLVITLVAAVSLYKPITGRRLPWMFSRNVDSTRARIAVIESAMESYHSDWGHYPSVSSPAKGISSNEALFVVLTGRTKLKSGLLVNYIGDPAIFGAIDSDGDGRSEFGDAWRRPLIVLAPSSSSKPNLTPVIISRGADGVDDSRALGYAKAGGDDIKSRRASR